MNAPHPSLPAAALSGDSATFGRYLASRQQEYLIVGELRPTRARVRFLGTFQGRRVVWDCQFVALAGPGEAGEGMAAARRNYIEIGTEQPHGLPLGVGLNIALIDRPAIEKMIIMVRNYKRLRPGRHEYGPAGGVQSHTITPQRSR